MEDPLWRLTTESSVRKRKRANHPLCEGRWRLAIKCSARIEGCDGPWVQAIGLLAKANRFHQPCHSPHTFLLVRWLLLPGLVNSQALKGCLTGLA